MAYVVTLSNSAGELDRRVVNTEEETRAAVLDIVSSTAHFADGDVIRVTERD